jgi:hypothetical protein
MDLTLAGWLLSLGAFLLGTAAPFVYRRFTFEGISIKPLDARAVLPSHNDLVFGTLIRIGNVSGRALLIDNIQVDPIRVTGETFLLKSSLLAKVTDTRDVHIPIWRTDSGEVLPIILKNETVEVYVLEMQFSFDGHDLQEALEVFGCVLDEPFQIRLRVNGTYRRYGIDFSTRQALVGYNIAIGEEPPDP